MIRAFWLALLLPGLAWGQTPAPASAPAAGVIARRGELTMTEAQFRALLAELPPEQRAALARDPAGMGNFLRNRLVVQALAAEAEATQFERQPEVQRRLERARADALAEAWLESQSRPEAGYPSEAEVQAVYDANRSQFMVPRQYRLAQIFLAAPEGPGGEAALRRLREYRAQLVAARNRGDFADLARRHSEDRGSAARGGELDWTREDRLLPAVREAVKGMEEGAISEPLRSPDGWHLLRLLGTRPAAPAPFAEVKGELAAALRQQRAAELRRLALNEFLRRGPVMVDEIQLGRVAADPALRP